MAPRNPTKSTKEMNNEPCAICGIVIARKADVPRHAKLHVADKSKLVHRCPFEGCHYTNLQKSNVTTHIRTHTGEKSQHCLDCDFSTSDPGSLTRHKKRIHGYVPKKRNYSGKASAAKRSNRHSPYSRGASSNSSSSTATSSTDDLFDFSMYLSASSSATSSSFPTSAEATYGLALDNGFAYPWKKEQTLEELTRTLAFDVSLVENLNPKQLFPAADAGHPLEGADYPQQLAGEFVPMYPSPYSQAQATTQESSPLWAGNLSGNLFSQAFMDEQSIYYGIDQQTALSPTRVEYDFTVPWTLDSSTPIYASSPDSFYSASLSESSFSSPPVTPAFSIASSFAPMTSNEQMDELFHGLETISY